MSDLQILFLVLVAIYGWECLAWVRRGSVAFRNWFGREYTLLHPGRVLGNQAGGVAFAWPVPPLGTFFIAHHWAVSLSPDTAFAFVASSVNPGSRPSQSGNCQVLEKIRNVTAEARKVVVDGEVFIRAASPCQAVYLAETLRELTSMPENKRGKTIQRVMREALDIKAIEQRCGKFQSQTHRLRVLTNSLFVYLFVLAPAVIWRFGLANSWIGLLAALLACTSTIALLFRRLHQQFFPTDEDGRFTHFLTILLSPATAVRALDLLSQSLLENFHPLAVAKVLCSQEAFEDFAAQLLRDLRYPARPVCPCLEPAAIPAEQTARSLFQQEVEQALKRWGVDSAKLLQSPIPADSACRSYCPRCLAQFITATGVCEDCGGIPLCGFEATDSPAL